MIFVKNFHLMQQISLSSRCLEKKVLKQSVNLGSIAVVKSPDCRGIDGTHNGIKAPQNESKIDYFCRKQKCSVNRQAVVGANLMVLYLATGYPGSLHDSRVLRNSNIFWMTENGDVLSYPGDIIENARISPLILGDGGYPLMKWLVLPTIFHPTLQ